jgi:sugar lactone lactonase YvrE
MRSPLSWRRNACLTLLSCIAGMVVAPTAALGKVYFTADLGGGGTGVERAGLDGGGLELLQLQPTGFEDGLALDVPDGRMYWTDTFASVIMSANLDGSNAQILVDDFGAEPLGIALDLARGKMYWTDMQGVKRASLGGGEVELLTEAAARGYIALDSAAQRMYWADQPSGNIKAAAMKPNPTVTTLVKHQASAFGIALDPRGGKVYWLELNQANRIMRANLDGSGVQALLERPGAGFDGGFAIDSSAGKLYWSETEARRIGVSNLDGSAPHVLLTTGVDHPEGLAVETADPRPTSTAPPFIEGVAQVGSPLVCQPGTWSTTGPASFTYQWALAGGGPIEGATGTTYVPFAEQAGQMLTCTVSASDDVATTTATSAPVTVAAAALPEETPRASLIAAIALSRLTVSGSVARVEVFTSFAGRATLWAIPSRWPRGARTRRARAHGRGRPPTLSRSEQLAPGRHTIVLHGLRPGTTYRLLFEIRGADGQRASDVATLRVRAR